MMSLDGNMPLLTLKFVRDEVTNGSNAITASESSHVKAEMCAAESG